MSHTMKMTTTFGVLMSAIISCNGASFDPGGVLRLVGRHQAVWTEMPSRTPADHSVDGPLMGNGDMKVALGGPPEEQRFYLAKNDLWRLKSQYGQSCPVGFGHLDLRIPELEGASYRLEQTWAVPETAGTFARDDLTVRMRSMVLATRNLLVLELEAEGAAVEGEAILRVASGRGSLSQADRRGDVMVAKRAFLEDVDIESGVAVAWKVMGAGTMTAASGEATARTASYRINLGREQHGGGRWGFQGLVDDLRVYPRALSAEEMKALKNGAAPEGTSHTWSMDAAPKGDAAVEVVPGWVGGAWRFTGDTGSFLDLGALDMPSEPVTVAGWVKIEQTDGVANYILSCGEWNKGISLGLSAGKLRFAVNGRYVESPALPKDQWLHLAGTWDGSRMAAYVNGEEAKVSGSTGAQPLGMRFTLEPGRPVYVVLAMDSVFKSKDYVENVVQALSGVSDKSDLSDLRQAHAAWWTGYWARSWVEIDDPEIEKGYYRSLYHMGALSRDPLFPPAIFGVVTTDTPYWHGDYHLNYNHVAPFYALYSANRIEQADPEDAPLLDFRERGRWYAENVTKTRGVLYPVGVGPLGIETTRNASKYGKGPNAEQGGLFFQQRSNSAYCLVNIAQRWRTTYEHDYGKKVYPFVKDVVEFWEDYLKWQDDRYIIVGDAIHEGSGQNMNPILTLGLVRNALDLALDMNEALKGDVESREKWRHILSHLSSWTTQQRDGEEVFRYTEKGTPWWRDNTLGIQHIYPGNALGLDSDPKWLDVAHNTIGVMGRWNDYNGCNSFFPAAVRVGYDPKVILEQLRRYVNHTYPNGFMKGNPHGIENYSTTPNTINEMLCMSHVPVGNPDRAESVIRVFPVWPKEHDASFLDLRTWGAFLVSSELKDGEVLFVRISSEKGRDCTIANPWPGKQVTMFRNGKMDGSFQAGRFVVGTAAGDTLILRPEGADR